MPSTNSEKLDVVRPKGGGEASAPKKSRGTWGLLGKLFGRSQSSVHVEPSLSSLEHNGSGSLDSPFVLEAFHQPPIGGQESATLDPVVRSYASVPLLTFSPHARLPLLTGSSSSGPVIAPVESSSSKLPHLPPLQAWSSSSGVLVENSNGMPSASQVPSARPSSSTTSIPGISRIAAVTRPITSSSRLAEMALPSPSQPSTTLRQVTYQPMRATRSMELPQGPYSTAFPPQTPLPCFSALSAPQEVDSVPLSALPQRAPSALAPGPASRPAAIATPSSASHVPDPSQAHSVPLMGISSGRAASSRMGGGRGESSGRVPNVSGGGGSGSGSGNTTLAVGPGAPASMRRPVWRLADYSISGRLYRGDFSSVYKATCLASGVKVVLKVYCLELVPENALHTLVREIRIHSALSHDAILQLYGVFEESERLVLVLERAARGDLFSLHRRLPGCRMSEDQARGVVLVPLLEALVYCHARGVCHRDIKPENLLLTADWQLRVADFGAAIDLSQERAVTRTGTADYMAPEVVRCPLKAAPEDNKDVPELAYTTAADVWSVGVLAFELLVGFPPFIRLDCGRRVPAAVGAGGERAGPGAAGSGVSFLHFVSGDARDFIALALAERAVDRPTAAQLLRHPWLRHARREARARRSERAAAAVWEQREQHAAAFAAASAVYPQQQQQR